MADGNVVAKDLLSEARTELARRAGKARLVKMTPEERKRIAKLAAAARWSRKHVQPDPTPPDPNGPHRDAQWSEAGIMTTPASGDRKPARPVSDSVNSSRGGLGAAA